MSSDLGVFHDSHVAGLSWPRYTSFDASFLKTKGSSAVLVPFNVTFAYIHPFSSGNRCSSDEDRGYNRRILDNSKTVIRQSYSRLLQSVVRAAP